MEGTLDYNKITAELIQNYLKQIATGFTGGGVSAWKSVQNKFKISYSKYLKAAVKKYTKTKTILYRDKPVPLYEFYEHVKVKFGNRVVDTTDLDTLLSINERLVISGTAGSGKSTLLKHLFLNSLTKKRVIPLFLELRNLNNYEGSLLDHMYDTIYNLGFILEKEYFLKSLTTGGIIIFLDGYDEIRNDLKPGITKQILDLSTKYSKNYIIVSSRPDDEFISWNDFVELRALPLDRDQAFRLISKLSYDEAVKGKFLTELKSGLYEKHKDFLSIPLLLTIMLMTYGQNANIPNKMHIFYSQVFDTLFNKHDATKSVYKRKMFTHLAIDDFRTVLSAFSILSYSNHTTVFSYEEAISYLSKVRRITNIGFKEDAYLKDLLKSVCILNLDGLVYTFTHKTFQEFFSAIYIAKAEPAVQDKLLQTLDWDTNNNKVLQMLFEMDPDLIERKLILPRLEAMSLKINLAKPAADEDRLSFIKNLFSAILLHPDGRIYGWRINNSDDWHFCYTLKRFYPRLSLTKSKYLTEKQEKSISALAPSVENENQTEISLDDLSTSTELAKIILSEQTTLNSYIDFIKAVWNNLKKKHEDKAQSIEEILFQKQ